MECSRISNSLRKVHTRAMWLTEFHTSRGIKSIFRGLIGENRRKLNVSDMTILHLTVFERFSNYLRLTKSDSDAINKKK